MTPERKGPGPREVPPDAPEADVLEQAREWEDDEIERPRRVPIDAPEADVLEQSLPADLDEDDHGH
jgi:hypothetical protein